MRLVKETRVEETSTVTTRRDDQLKERDKRDGQQEETANQKRQTKYFVTMIMQNIMISNKL